MQNITFGFPANEGWFAIKDWISVGVALIGFAGVILTLFWNGRRQQQGFAETARLQREADARKFEAEIKLRVENRQHEVAVARSVVFAQITRVYRTLMGEYAYLANSPLKFIWISLYTTILPSPDALKRIEVLTPDEVFDITAFYYSYHEHMGYIAAASGGIGKTSLKFDYQLVGVNFSDADRELRWLLYSLQVLDRKALAAMNSIFAAATADYGSKSSVVERLEQERGRNEELAIEAAPHLSKLKKANIEQTSEDPTSRF